MESPRLAKGLLGKLENTFSRRFVRSLTAKEQIKCWESSAACWDSSKLYCKPTAGEEAPLETQPLCLAHCRHAGGGVPAAEPGCKAFCKRQVYRPTLSPVFWKL